MTLNDELKKQIEDAFHYRGHVTLTFQDGKTVEGYLFNRDYEWLDVFLKGSGDKARYWMKDLQSIALTGVDEAAGKSYQEWMKKKEKN